MSNDMQHNVDIGPLVAECLKRGIARTTAFRLAREGKLETFCIGRKRYVSIPSFAKLPAALQINQGGK